MRIRASWLVVLVTIALAVALPSLRQVTKTALSATTYLPIEYGFNGGGEWDDDNFPLFFGRYRAGAVEWVRREVPDDPDLLLGAGLLAYDKDASRELLRRAAERAKSGPAWGVYTQRLVAELPAHASLAESGVDPADPVRLAESLKELQQRGLPEQVPSEDAEPALRAARAWAAADPSNALPLVVEAELLHSAGRVKESLVCWEGAARRPRYDTYTRARSHAIAKVMVRMGLPAAVAVRAMMLGVQGPNESYAQTRHMARIAQHEGFKARMEGRSAEAIRWWRSTSDLGQHMQTSADTTIAFLVGSAVEGIGAAPAWKWYPNSTTRYWSGPLMGGAIWYGPYHDFYVRQVGVREDAALRDRLVLCKVRSQLTRNSRGGFALLQTVWFPPSFRFTALSLVAASFFLLLYLCLASWGRADTEAATNLKLTTYLAITAAAAAPFTLAALYALNSLTGQANSTAPLQAVTVGFVFSLAVAVFLPLIVTPTTRVRGFSLTTAWRGNLWRVLPPMVALSLLLFLGFAFEASRGGSWMDQWLRVAPNEFTVLTRSLGPAWKHPKVPAGAWQARHPVLYPYPYPPPAPPPPARKP